ncbi:MAG TPA: phosphotransferase, partial [Coleofasciculaceae cyanobacterium]
MTRLTTAVESLLADFGLVAPQLERIRAGRNSRVWRVDCPGGTYILKEYFRHPGDPRDRLATEYGFLTFLQAQGVTIVPQPLGRDVEGKAALYSYLPGVPVAAIQPDHIQQSARFIHQINQRREGAAAQSLPEASEACFSLEEHLQRVKLRLQGLQVALVDLTNPWYVAANQLLSEQLWPTYQRLEQQIRSNHSAAELSRNLDSGQRILSPSDFGFHNMLEAEGHLYFLDFEYA